MSKFTHVFCCIALLDAVAAHGVTMTPQIQQLLTEKQNKIAELEKCDRRRQGFMIAGISTIGLTALGVAGNIALANKSNNLSTEIDANNQKLKDIQTKITDTQNKISQHTSELNTQAVTQDEITSPHVSVTPKGSSDNSTKTATSKATPQKPTTEAVVTSRVVAERGVTEPNVDANQWTKEAYKQCFENFFNSNSSGLSNVRNYWGKSPNGEYCDGYEGGKYLYDYKKSPNSCSNKNVKALSNGEWMIKLKNGKTMRGEAICSDTRGTTEDELRDSIDMSGYGLNCWCRLTETELSECLVTQQFSWRYAGDFWLVGEDDIEDFNDGYDKYHNLMPRAYYQLGENSCVWYCANECGYQLFDYGSHRQRAMHGVPLIKEFIIDR